tara:strand:+ start:1101 stop:1343 length:243 start_codon:yes stop_codon:yes gene_type:complete
MDQATHDASCSTSRFVTAFEKPKFEVKVKALGNVNLLELPALGAWMRTCMVGDFLMVRQLHSEILLQRDTGNLFTALPPG